MTPAALKAWMTRLGLNKSEAAESLGISRSTLDRYLNGKNAIPHKIKLACDAIETWWPKLNHGFRQGTSP